MSGVRYADEKVLPIVSLRRVYQMRWLVLLVAISALLQQCCATELFRLSPTTVWTKTPPALPKKPLEGALRDNFTIAVNQRDGSLYIQAAAQMANVSYQYAIASTPILASIPKLNSTLPNGAACSERRLTVTLSYVIPNNFSNYCADNFDGMELLFLLAADYGTTIDPAGTGTLFTGGADVIKFPPSNPSPYYFFQPTARAFLFSPPQYCTSEQSGTCHIEVYPVRKRFSYGNYSTTSVLSVNASTGGMTVISMLANFNGTQYFSLNATKLYHYPLAGKKWLGQPSTSGGAVTAPLLYFVTKCIDTIISEFTIVSDDVCSATTSSSIATTASASTSAKTTRQSSPATSIATAVTTTSSAVTATAITATVTSDPASNFTNTLLPSITNSSTVYTDGSNLSESSSAGLVTDAPNNTNGDLNTPLFVVIGLLIGCMFCTALCCVFRKTIRRTSIVRRIYIMTPARRALCCCLGSSMEDEAARDDEIFDFEKFLQGDDYDFEQQQQQQNMGGGSEVTQYLNLTDDQRKTLKKSAAVAENDSDAQSAPNLLDKARSMRSKRPQQTQIQRRNSTNAEYGNVLPAIEAIAAANEYSPLPNTEETRNAAQKNNNVIYDRVLPKNKSSSTIAGYDRVVPPELRQNGNGHQYNSIEVDSRSMRGGATIKDAMPMEVSDDALEGSSSDNEVHVTNTKITGQGRNQYESTAGRLTLSPLTENQ